MPWRQSLEEKRKEWISEWKKKKKKKKKRRRKKKKKQLYGCEQEC